MQEQKQNMTTEEIHNKILAELTLELEALKKRTILIQVCLWLSIIVNVIIAIIMPGTVLNKLKLSIFF